MSDDVKQSWRALGERISALGALLQQRFKAGGEERTTSDGHDDDAAIKSALDQLASAGRELGERVGDVAQDDTVRATARDTLASLDDALRATVELIVDEVEGVLERSKRDDH